jgi:hypothetical protein
VLPFQEPKQYLKHPYDGYGLTLGRSEIYLRLSTRSTLFAFFSLPFETPDKEFIGYREFLQNHFPIKLSDKHWKHWELTKSGKSYRKRMLQ